MCYNEKFEAKLKADIEAGIKRIDDQLQAIAEEEERFPDRLFVEVETDYSEEVGEDVDFYVASPDIVEDAENPKRIVGEYQLVRLHEVETRVEVISRNLT